MENFHQRRAVLALLPWGISLWFLLAGAGASCAVKAPSSYDRGYRAGYQDYDSARYEHGDPRRLAEDPEYLQGYRKGMAEREQETIEKKDGLWGLLTGKW